MIQVHIGITNRVRWGDVPADMHQGRVRPLLVIFLKKSLYSLNFVILEHSIPDTHADHFKSVFENISLNEYILK